MMFTQMCLVVSNTLRDCAAECLLLRGWQYNAYLYKLLHVLDNSLMCQARGWQHFNDPSSVTQELVLLALIALQQMDGASADQSNKV